MSDVNITPDSEPNPDPAGVLRGDEPVAEPASENRGHATSEETLWTGRTHWKHSGGSFTCWGVVSLVLLVASIAWLEGWWLWALVAAFGAGIVLVVKTALAIIGTKYTLTTERLFIERGLISLTKDQTELIRVDDVRVRKTLFDRVFGLGTVDVFTTDQSDGVTAIEGVAGADEVAEMVRTHMRRARKKSLFIESL